MQHTKAGRPRNNTEEALSFRSSEGQGKFLTTVNDLGVRFVDPMPDGGQILEESGFLPARDYVLIQLQRHSTRSVGLDELVDLRRTGAEAFWAFKSDRVFRFTINNRGYEWGAAKITEPEVRRIAGVGDDEILVLERNGVDKPLDPGGIVDLGRSGTEQLRTTKGLITVYLDNVETTIRCGTYTAEELIRVFGVDAGYLLNVVNGEGQLSPLGQKQRIEVKNGMKFFTQVPCGGSS